MGQLRHFNNKTFVTIVPSPSVGENYL